MGVSADLIQLFQYLLPGFLTAWIFFGLTGYEKSSQFERVIQALIFTVVVQAATTAAVSAVRYFVPAVGSDGLISAREVVAALMAVITGLILAIFTNHDWLHRGFRKIGITRQTSYPSEWFGTLKNHEGYVVLHLKDERRLYGWIVEFPQSTQRGHFYIAQPSWLESDGKEINVWSAGVRGILLSVEDVQWVELMESEGIDNGQTSQ